MTERIFLQIDNIWVNSDSIDSVVDDPENEICTIYSRDLTRAPVVLRESARASFLHFLENHSYCIPFTEPPKSPSSSGGRAIPATVLIDICRAIMQDKYALTEAAKTMIPIRNDFIAALNSVISYISEPEVRELAINELQGVRHDSNNK